MNLCKFQFPRFSQLAFSDDGIHHRQYDQPKCKGNDDGFHHIAARSGGQQHGQQAQNTMTVINLGRKRSTVLNGQTIRLPAKPSGAHPICWLPRGDFCCSWCLFSWCTQIPFPVKDFGQVFPMQSDICGVPEQFILQLVLGSSAAWP